MFKVGSCVSFKSNYNLKYFYEHELMLEVGKSSKLGWRGMSITMQIDH